MSIRARLTGWYAAVMFASLLAMSALLYREFAPEPRKPGVRFAPAPGEADNDEGDRAEALRILLWCGVPAAALALGGGWWLVRKALAPVAALTRAAEQLTEGNLAARLPRTGTGDECDRLTEVFNAMTARLHDAFTRIRDFTMHASHELKTPLTVLCAETETALRDPSLSMAQRERSASQLDELRRLARIVDSLTLLAKADAGLIPLALEPVRFDRLLRDIFADVQILAGPSGLRLELTACEEVRVQGDPHRLRQLLLNLADNAVKYNQPHGAVTMALRRADHTAELVISNTGPGIAAESLPRVFDRFFRGDPAQSHQSEGCGLGLSIAQWIVSAHKGSIHIESAPSQLTTVTVRLPLGGPERGRVPA